MKYIITESKLNNAIESYIVRTFPQVYKVELREKKVMLGSTKGNPVKNVTVIHIVIDNTEKMGMVELSELKNNIIDNVNSMFSLGWPKYDGDWDFVFDVLVIIPYNNYYNNNIE